MTKTTYLFHDGGRYYIETSLLICSANQWTGFYLITACVMKWSKCIPVFSCPKCFKEDFFTFPSYAFKKYIENGERNLANVQKEFCKENRAQFQSMRSYKFCINFKETSLEEFTRGIKLYLRRGINNNYNCYASASF